GWIAGELYLEVNPDADESLELDETGKYPAAGVPTGLRAQVTRAAGKSATSVDWTTVDSIGVRRFGIPSRITRRAEPATKPQAGAPVAR
ncbi:MAG: hypothetical protein ACREJT_07545, partial [Myxococcota bacterium]